MSNLRHNILFNIIYIMRSLGLPSTAQLGQFDHSNHSSWNNNQRALPESQISHRQGLELYSLSATTVTGVDVDEKDSTGVGDVAARPR